MVPSLGVDGADADAVQLFVERAQAVHPGFSLDDEAAAEAVAVICRRLDGIPLAIELAAARMVSMTPIDVRDRLGDRFRLLSGGRRRAERHQTLRHTVAWSYDLLTDRERFVLGRCAAFPGGFNLASITHLCDLDEYTVLDVVDSLVRKSLVTLEQLDGHARYGMLETIRQFATEHLAATDTIAEVWDRHARYFAAQAVAHWDIWDGPRIRVALDWVDVEFANLRAGFRWAADHHDVEVAAAIAAHTTMISWIRQRYESVGWAEEILQAATATKLVQLPRLYTAASLCLYAGRPDAAVAYAETAAELETDPRYDPFPTGHATNWAGPLHVHRSRRDVGQHGRRPAPGLRRTLGGALKTWVLPAVGRAEEARTLADDALAAARGHGNPVWITVALAGHGRAFADTDPARARRALVVDPNLARREPARPPRSLRRVRCGRTGSRPRRHRPSPAAAGLRPRRLPPGRGPQPSASPSHTWPYFFDRTGPPTAAATLYGASTRTESNSVVVGLPDAVSRLRSQLGHAFDASAATGAAMDFGEAVAYARQLIRVTGRSGELT